MAELVSYLSIEPHMRTFDVFTATLSPAHAGLFLRPARFPAPALLLTPNSHHTPIMVGVCPNCDSNGQNESPAT